MAELWTSAIVYDRVVAVVGAYGTTIDGTNSVWATPATGVIPTVWINPDGEGAGDSSPGPAFSDSAVLFEHFGASVWFGQIIIVPTNIALGNLLSTQIRTIELFNSTFGDITYDSFVNNTDSGVIILNQPSLPATIGTFDSIVLNVQISSQGPPSIDGTLDFFLEISTLRQTAMTAARVVMMPVRPSNPTIRESLEFKTDIMRSKDGTEQRVRVREYPRQRIGIDYFEYDDEAANLRALLFEWLPRVWGVPIWWEERSLGVDIAVDDSTITVDTTFGDFRVGSVCLIFEDQFTWEALEIESFTDTDITFTSPALAIHLAKNTTVLPVRFAYANSTGPTEKHMVQGQQKITIDFTTIENTDLGDASVFPTYKGRVILDEPNLVRGSNISESWMSPVRKLDPGAGPPLQLAREDRSQIATRKTFFCASPARLWAVRQLVHFLQGSVTPFYLPSFRPDMRVMLDIGASAASFTIKNINFTDFVGSRQPWKNLRLVLNNGTAHVREILSSSVVDADTELVTVDSAFSGSAISVADIKRVELVVLVRMRKDKVTFEHTIPGYAAVSMEVLTVRSDP